MRAAAWLLALAACADPTESSVLDGPRVLAVVADPPVVAPGVRTTLVPITTVDGVPTPPERVTWRACRPWSVVADPERDCADGVTLATGPDGRAVIDPDAFGAVPGSSSSDPGLACAPPVLSLTLIADVQLAGARLLAKKQLAFAQTVDRRNPLVEHALIDGEPATGDAVVPPGATLRLGARIAADSVDEVCGGSVPAREAVRVVVYPGRGAVASDDSFEIVERDGELFEGSVELTLPAASMRVPLWLVAVDETGGAAATFLELGSGELP